MSGQHDSTWSGRARETAYQGLYLNGPSLSITTDNQSSGRFAWLQTPVGPPPNVITNIQDWPLGPWIPIPSGTTTPITPPSLPANARIEGLVGTLTCKSIAP
jgi:hypothetical protein